MLDTLSLIYNDTLTNVVTQVSSNTETLLMTPFGKDVFSSPWVVVGILFLFVVYCVVFSSSKKYLKAELSSFFEEKDRSSFSVSFPPQYFYSKLVLFFLSQLSMGYFLFRFSLFFTEKNMPIFIIFFSLAVLLFLLLGDLLMFFIGIVFFQQKQSSQYIKKHFSLFAFSGVVLFPLMVFSLYTFHAISVVVFCIATVFIVILLIILCYKLLQIFSEKKVALFYLMLYLCIWKILPIMAFVKMLFEVSLL